MNILLVSECTHKALTETRRVLDQFAERTGRRTWQTAITLEGLKTVHYLLRKTARRNTAVACFWIRGKNRTELLWTVGKRGVFNERGRVPTNRTTRKVDPSDEHHWHYAKTIQILSALAALFHDLGKATIGFQQKLWDSANQKRRLGDPFRHEWLSLRLFLLMVDGCENNTAVLERLMNFAEYKERYQLDNGLAWYQALTEYGGHARAEVEMGGYPPIVQMIGWIIVSHHRMPFFNRSIKDRQRAKTRKELIHHCDYEYFFDIVEAKDGWVKNKNSDGADDMFWQLKEDPTSHASWLKALNRWATKARNYEPLQVLTVDSSEFQNPLTYHLSRLVMMMGDHDFSSQVGQYNLTNWHRTSLDETDFLVANLHRGELVGARQTLPEHLIGVTQKVVHFAHHLPFLKDSLPVLQENREFRKRVSGKHPYFQWQNQAVDVAESLQESSHQAGFFGINMASTGRGKTLANAKILANLNEDNKGARFTVALGLRVLTLQTGTSFQERLKLSSDELAVLVGGKSAVDLYELNREEHQQKGLPTDAPSEFMDGSESATDFVAGDVFYDGVIQPESLGISVASGKAQKLLFAPVVVTTIDQLIAASESLRGGRQIVPSLRLLTSDLILDEIDDFNIDDMAAISRFIYLAGLLGSRIILSSATLQPAMVAGLFESYQAGYTIWQENQGITARSLEGGNSCAINIAWFDEFASRTELAVDRNDLLQKHDCFVSQRIEMLRALPIKHRGAILELPKELRFSGNGSKSALDYGVLAKSLLIEAEKLHQFHHEIDEKTGKKVSVGIIRIANIKEIIPIVQALYESSTESQESDFYVVAYHARQLLALRNQLENSLDRILSRTEPLTFSRQPEVRALIEKSSRKNQVFIIVASPVAEVGRDHDYDWAIIEPSSMRSIIQMAGRVWRHRALALAENSYNISLLESNLKSLKSESYGVGTATFERPGFESKAYLLHSHLTADILKNRELEVINSEARIRFDYGKTHNIDVCDDSASDQYMDEKGRYYFLSDLEHAVMEDLFSEPVNYRSAYQQRELAHHLVSHLQILSPFRENVIKEEEYVCQISAERTSKLTFRDLEVAWEAPFDEGKGAQNSCFKCVSLMGVDDKQHKGKEAVVERQVKPWLIFDPIETIYYLAKAFKEPHEIVALRYNTVSLKVNSNDEPVIWNFHPALGFWEM